MRTGKRLLGALLVVQFGCRQEVSTSRAEGHPQDTTTLEPIRSATVVCYNVENLFDTQDDPTLTGDDEYLPGGVLNWTEERYRSKLEHLAEAIAMAGDELPMIIGLVEVENAQVALDLAITPPLDKGNYILEHFDSPDERGIDVALLVQEGPHCRADHAEALTVRLPGGDATRDVLYARLELAIGEPLHVFVNHWPSRREGVRESEPKRMAAAAAVRKKVDEILAADANSRIIVMGDLNDTPLDRSIRDGLAAAVDTASKDRDLYDLVYLDERPNAGSHQFDGEWAYLDHIIVSRGMVWPKSGFHALGAGAVQDSRLLFDHPRFGPSPNRTYGGKGKYHGGYSDHLPVVLQLVGNAEAPSDGGRASQ
ncbi:MAG: endonuclease/exonuclease/phosphatase family protein [Flavobacteriales bacterium]|nr:endonuclease/exonuclease/phosphatase family protein [Flavobacteriales bacterium]